MISTLEMPAKDKRLHGKKEKVQLMLDKNTNNSGKEPDNDGKSINFIAQ